MVGSLGAYDTAAAMRDIVRRLVREELQTYRPSDRFARAISKDLAQNKALVLVAGDTQAISVNMSQGCIPTKTDTEDGVNSGSIVRISGTPGNYWITQLCSGPEFQQYVNLYRPRLAGGDLGTKQIEMVDTVDGGMPALGNAWHMGRWENTAASSSSPGLAIVEVIVAQTTLTAVMKRYRFVINGIDATNSNWAYCAAEVDNAMLSSNHDFELEVMGDATGFELRVRRSSFDPGGLPTAGYTLFVRIAGEEWVRASNGTGETSAARATQAVNNVSNFVMSRGPFIAPALNIANLAQTALSGGHDARWDGTNVRWGTPYRISGFGLNHMIPSGFYDVTCPTSGSVQVFGNSSGIGLSVSAVATGIPLTDGMALYYCPPWGSTTTASAVANFRIVRREHATKFFQVPSHWVLLCWIDGGVFYNANAQSIPGVSPGVAKIVQKTSTPTLATQIIPQVDADLQFTMLPGVKYRVQIWISASGSTPGFRTAWAGPADISGIKLAFGPAVHTTAGWVGREDTNARASAHGLATEVTYRLDVAGSNSALFEAGVISSTTGGTFQFKWAQAVSSATVTTVSGASWMEYCVVG